MRQGQSGEPDASTGPEVVEEIAETVGEPAGEPEADQDDRWNPRTPAIPPPIPYSQHEPVIRDEGSGRLRPVVWIVILLLVILGMVVIYTYLK